MGKSLPPGGWKALKAKKRGRPKGGKLKGWQSAVIKNLIRDRCPDQLKMPFALWTREAVGQLIEREFGIKLSVWTVGRYLSRWGFTPQKPLKRAYEQNPKEVEAWLKEEYPRIKQKAREEGAEIYWGDEVGIRSDHQAGRSWSPKGKTPVIERPGRRYRFNPTLPPRAKKSSCINGFRTHCPRVPQHLPPPLPPVPSPVPSSPSP